MSTKPCLFGKPLTGAERQARYRNSHPEYRKKANEFMISWRRKRKKLNAAAQQQSKKHGQDIR